MVLFNNIYYVASNGKMTVSDEKEKIWKCYSILRYYLRFCLEGLRKNLKNLSG